MIPQRAGSPHISQRAQGVLLCLLLSLVSGLSSAALYGREAPVLLHAANKLGPTAASVLAGHGLSVCYGPGEQARCLHGQRMPVAPLALAGLAFLLPAHRFVAVLSKALLFVLPVLLASVCLAQATYASRARRALAYALFAFAFVLPSTLDLVANFNFEEAYGYGFFLLAFTLLLFPCPRAALRRWAVLQVGSAAVLYLSKSSMLPAATALACLGAFAAGKHFRRKAVAFAMVSSFAAVPLLWGAWQLHATGRFTPGTTLDGANLYKGNNPGFLDHYPAWHGASQDVYEAELFAGHTELDDWSENDYGRSAAIAYMRSHPQQTFRAAARKAEVFFLAVRESDDETMGHRHALATLFLAGTVGFRILLLAALGCAAYRLFARRTALWSEIVFFGTTACVAAPYLLGFALIRHAYVLALPAAVYLCHVLQGQAGGNRYSTQAYAVHASPTGSLP